MPSPVEPRVLRVLPEVRSAHLERAAHAHAARTLYLEARDDFDLGLAARRGDFERHTPRSLLREVRRREYDVIEVGEPLWLRWSPFIWLVLVASGSSKGRVQAVSYAIENARPSKGTRRGGALVDLWRQTWARAVSRRLTRVAFGTTDARDTLMRNLTPRQATAMARRSTVITALPAPCECLEDSRSADRGPTAVFVGALESRKGFDALIAAWPLVVDRLPVAELTVLGDGPLAPLAQEAAAAFPGVHYLGRQERDGVHAALRSAKALVLVSRADRWWREQVGLPIVEGLAHGCHVITTTESSLSGWVGDHAGFVIAGDPSAEKVADAIVSALSRTAEWDVDALPAREGRLLADDWLLDPSSSADLGRVPA